MGAAAVQSLLDQLCATAAVESAMVSLETSQQWGWIGVLLRRFVFVEEETVASPLTGRRSCARQDDHHDVDGVEGNRSSISYRS